MPRLSSSLRRSHGIRLILALVACSYGPSLLKAQAPPCVAFPNNLIPFVSIDYVSGFNGVGDRLVVGTLGGSAPLSLINSIALPTATNQKFCDPVEFAPGLLANAYVPTAAERRGDYSPFAGLLLDPLTCTGTFGGPRLARPEPRLLTCSPFPGGIVPTSRLGFFFAWRISSGAIGDALGDVGAGVPDLFVTSATVSGGNLRLAVHFLAGTFSATTTVVAVSLDTDQFPKTGHPGTNAGGVDDAAVLGTDYLVEMGAKINGGRAHVLKYAGTVNNFNEISTAPVSVFANRIETVIPLSTLQDEGVMNFKVTVATQLDATSTTTVQDQMTDLNVSPGHTELPGLRFSTTVPAASPGSPYSHQFTGGGGSGGYTWTATGLPAWLTLSSAGALSGTPPASSASVSINVTLKDSLGSTVTQTVVIAIGPAITTPSPLPPAVPGAAYSATLSASGGAGGYTWTATGLPTWLTLNATTGVLSGTAPANATSASLAVSVKDTAGNTAIKTLVLPVTLTITSPGTLPAGSVGQAYSYALTASGGTGTGYQWSLSSNPAWLTVTAAGQLGGTIPADGTTVTFTASVKDSAGNTATKNLTLPVGLTITSASPLPTAAANTTYRFTFAATGGAGIGYTWTATELPDWLTLSPAGVLSGSVPANAGVATFTITVTDSSGATASKRFVLPVTLVITSTSPLPTAPLGAAYTYQFIASGGSGTGYSWSGSGLPSWLTLSAAGVLTGTPPTGATSATITVKVSDSAGNSDTKTFLVPVGKGVSISSPTTLPNATPNSLYTYIFTATGGQGAGYTWVGSGLPDWLTLGPTGQLNGTPPANSQGSYSLTVRVTDSGGATASGQFQLTVIAITPPVIRTLSPSTAIAGGLPFSITIDGSNFTSTSTVQWNSSTLPTRFVSASQVTANVSSDLIATPNRATVSVINQSVVSNSLPFTVSGPAPAGLVVSQTGFTFQATQNGPALPPRSFRVSTAGSAISFTVAPSTLSGGSRWLSATPGSGSTDASPNVTVQVDPTGLDPGDYYGQVRITSTAATNPQVVTIALTVTQPAVNPGPVVDPIGAVFVAAQGSSPASRTITVSNPNSTSLTFTASAIFPDSRQWFSPTPPGGTLQRGGQTGVTISPSAASLPPGVYQAQLNFAFSDGSSRLVTLVLVVPRTAAAQNFSAARRLNPAADSGCTPTQIIPVFVVLGTGAGLIANVGTPVAMDVVALDDCGVLLETGSVQATFTNGDQAVGLHTAPGTLNANDAARGHWTNSWTPRDSHLANLTVTVTALSADRTLKGVTFVSVSVEDNLTAPVIGDQAPVVSAAAYNAIPAPGTLVAITGLRLADGIMQSDGAPRPVDMRGTSVVLGETALPLLYASPQQINAIIPYGVSTNIRHALVVRRGQRQSSVQQVMIGDAQPAIFTTDASGQGQGHIYTIRDNNQVLAGPSSPAAAGDALVIWCAGLGPVSPPVAAGLAAPSDPLSLTALKPISLTIGGVPATVTFSGLAPGFTGLYQLNAVMPAGVTAGSATPVVLSVAGTASPPVTMAVQ